jgi:WD40 repeat protein
MTALYAAPEFFQGKTSQHSDQYSLAVTYCQLRGGRLPFSGDPAQVMAGHLHGQPDLTMLPESERPAVARALAKDPGQRWPSCTAFVQALAVMGRSVGNQLVLDPGTDSKELMPCLPRWPRRRGEWLEKIRSRPWLVVLLLAPVILGAMAVLLTCSRGWLSSPDRDRSVPPASKITEPVLVEPLVFRGPTVGVNGLAFLPGNRAVSCNEDGTLCLWDLTEGKPLSILMKHSGPLRCLAVSPDGKRVLAGGGAGHQTVPFWDVEARREVGCLRGHEHGVWGLAFLAGGDRAVSASLDGTVRVWDLSKQRELFRCQGCDLPDTRPVGYSRQVFSMACSRDGHRILCGLRSGVIRVFSAEDGKLVQSFAGHSQPVSCVAFLAGGKAASARCRNWEGEGEPDHTLRCWDLNQGIELICVPAPGAGVWCLLPLRDGRHLILSCEDGGVVLWDSQEKSMVRRWFGHPGPVTALALSADERQALSAGGGTLRLWSLTELAYPVQAEPVLDRAWALLDQNRRPGSSKPDVWRVATRGRNAIAATCPLLPRPAATCTSARWPACTMCSTPRRARSSRNSSAASRSSAPPVVADDRVYFATLGTQVYALRPDGEACWVWDLVKETMSFSGDRWSGADWVRFRKGRVSGRDQFCCSTDIAVYSKMVVVPAVGRTTWLEDTDSTPRVKGVGQIPDCAGDECAPISGSAWGLRGCPRAVAPARQHGLRRDHPPPGQQGAGRARARHPDVSTRRLLQPLQPNRREPRGDGP